MNYNGSPGEVPTTSHIIPLGQQITQDVIPSIDHRCWNALPSLPPFAKDRGRTTIRNACRSFFNKGWDRACVYVLECRRNTHPASTAAEYQLNKIFPWASEASQSRRPLYVGYTVDLLKRIDEHLNSPGAAGARFTTIFPPIRILDVSWYSHPPQARTAERITAQLLRKRFPRDYVYQR